MHQCVRNLAEILVRNADHQTRQHRRMFGQRVLDLGRVDVAPAHGEHVDPTVGQIQVALLVEPAQVAKGVPAVTGSRGAADVAVGRSAAGTGTHVDLPDHTRRALGTIVVEHLHFARHHPAHRAAMSQPLDTADEGESLKFGAAVEFPHHVRAEDLDPRLLDGGRTRRGQVPPPSYRRQVIAVRIGAVHRQQALHDGRHGGQVVDPVFGDQAQKRLGIESAHQHQVLAGRQCHGGRGESGVVAQRNRHQVVVGGQVAHDRRH